MVVAKYFILLGGVKLSYGRLAQHSSSHLMLSGRGHLASSLYQLSGGR